MNILRLLAFLSTTFVVFAERFVIPVDVPEVNSFYNVSATGAINVGDGDYAGVIDITAKLEERGETLQAMSFALHGGGDVVEVTGAGLVSWAVEKTAGGDRVLRVMPAVDLQARAAFKFQVRVEGQADTTGLITPLLLQSHERTSLKATTAFVGDGLRVVDLANVQMVETSDGVSVALTNAQAPRIRLMAQANGLGAMLRDAALSGEVRGDFIDMRLRGEVVIDRENVVLPILQSDSPMSSYTGEGRLGILDGFYTLTFAKAGSYPVELSFLVPIVQEGQWRSAELGLKPDSVLPISLTGFAVGSEFHPDNALRLTDGAGYLPLRDHIVLRWREAATSLGETFFNVVESTDTVIGAGLVVQGSRLRLEVLQGGLQEVEALILGEGDILDVTSPGLSAWEVVERDGQRFLLAKMSAPVATSVEINVRTQAQLGEPGRVVEPMRLQVQNAVRQSGELRLRNEGSLRFTLLESEALVQMQVTEFTGAVVKAEQVQVYQFPLADYGYSIETYIVRPTISVSELLYLETTETDRILLVDAELTVRDAPVTELSVEVPADYSVAAVDGVQVRDFLVSSEVVNGRRDLRILLKGEIEGRHLIQLRLEKNVAAIAGEITVPRLIWTDASDVRSKVGVRLAAGYRAEPEVAEGLRELAIAYFPKGGGQAQLAYQSKARDWQLSVKAVALGQNVQVDVLHLYHLQADYVRVAVMVNAVVLGAPVAEWSFRLPEGATNVAVEGAHVGGHTIDEQRVLRVNLQKSILGTSTVLVTYERAAGENSTLLPGGLAPLDVTSERGYVMVTSDGQVEARSEIVKGSVFELSPAGLPVEYRELTSAPPVLLFQYSARPFEVELDYDWLDREEQGDQLVEAAWLETTVSDNGQAVTEATYFVKARKSRVLELTLPDGGSPWQISVNGEAVTARMSGGQSLIPLPGDADPNAVHEVRVRYGQEAGELRSPLLEIPVVSGGWDVLAGADDLGLVHGGGNVSPESSGEPVQVKSQSWMLIAGIVLLGVAALLATVGKGTVLPLLSVGSVLAAGTLLLLSAPQYGAQPMYAAGKLSYQTPAMLAGEVAEIEIALEGRGAEVSSSSGLFLLFPGLLAIAFGLWKRVLWVVGAGAIVVLASLLLDPQWLSFLLLLVGGASLIFGTWLGVQHVRGLLQKPATATLLVCVLGSVLSAQVEAREPVLDALEQTITVLDDRVRAEGRVQLSSTRPVHFLHGEAALISFEGEGLETRKLPGVGGIALQLKQGVKGVREARFVYEVPLESLVRGFALPTGKSVMSSVEISAPGAWNFGADQDAIRQSSDGGSARFILRPYSERVHISAKPALKDELDKDTRFFVESAHGYRIGAGSIHGQHRIRLRIAAGRLGELVLRMPQGLLVGSVDSASVTGWAFDPKESALKLQLTGRAGREIEVRIATQMAAGAFPIEVDLATIEVEGAAATVGVLAVEFAVEAQPDAFEAGGMQEIAKGDFDKVMGAHSFENLHKVYRYTDEGGAMMVRVVPVTPELRVNSINVLSLGNERLLLSSELALTVSRVGIFSTDLRLPQGMELQTVIGEGVSHSTEREEDGATIVTVHYENQMLGVSNLRLTMTGAPTGAQTAWALPKVGVADASRTTGEYYVRPDRGLNLQIASRDRVSQLEDPGHAGSLAFRTLQSGWSVAIDIAVLEAWVSLQGLQHVEVREGQLRTVLRGQATIENAAVKSLRVKIFDDEIGRTLTATGAGVTGIVPAGEEEGVYRLEFNNAVIGQTDFVLEWTEPLTAGTLETTVEMVDFPGVRQQTLYLAVDSAAHLQAEPKTVGRGWQRIDWASVPEVIKGLGNHTQPALVYEVGQGESSLALDLERQSIARTLQMRVESVDLLTLLSAAGSSVTTMELNLEVLANGNLEMEMPADAELFSVLVAGEGVEVSMTGGRVSIPLRTIGEDNRAKVRVIYMSRGEGELLAPQLQVPMENVTWELHTPEGYTVAVDTRMDEEGGQAIFNSGREAYLAEIRIKKEMATRIALQQLDDANTYLGRGDQAAAFENFRRAAQNSAAMSDVNEDARVQLEVMRRRQMLLTLNTRQQRLQIAQAGELGLDKGAAASLVNANPYFNGSNVLQGQAVDQMISSVAGAELASLQRIAKILASQQLQTRSAPQVIDVSALPRGQKRVFRANLHLAGGEGLSLEVDLEPEGSNGAGARVTAAFLGALVIVLFLVFTRRSAGLEKKSVS